MNQLSIKGTAFDSVLQDVRALLEAGSISREELETGLEATDLAYLDQKIQPASWYPIECYARWLERLSKLESGGKPEAYLFNRGSTAAERLHAAGIYPQLDASANTLGLRVLPLVISLAGAIYNFTEWHCDVAPGGGKFTITVSGAQGYPNVARFAAEGFIHCTIERVTSASVQIWSERHTKDQVIFHGSVSS